MFNKVYYSTYEEASFAAQELGIKTKIEYTIRYKEDPKLPCHPRTYKEKYKGWSLFLNNKNSKQCYETYKEASLAAQKLNIKSSVTFKLKVLCKKHHLEEHKK